MIAPGAANKNQVASFRSKLSAAIMVIVVTITALALYLAQRNVTVTAERNSQQSFQTELSSLHKLQQLRDTALTERCRALVMKPRIHAALEDNALDLLYPTAKDELRDLMEGDEPPPEQAPSTLHARFYRFLDDKGAVLRPPNPKDVGALDPKEEAQLALKQLPNKPQVGYLSHVDPAEKALDEVAAVPIFSTESGDVISALVVGFKPIELAGKNSRVKSGIWVDGQLYLSSLPKPVEDALVTQISDAVANVGRAQNNFTVPVNGTPHLVFYKPLNPDSLFPPAYEICVYPLSDFIAQLRRLRWQIAGAGGLLLLGGFVTSHFVALRFSRPVEQLALDSERNVAQRKRVEAALNITSEKLKRSTQYSADASHQLKSPLTVLRAGLEALLSREDFNAETYEELSTLLHQTHRLNGVIEDLLLLSRMDAGHLTIDFEPVNLSRLVEDWLDDLSALPDSPDVKIQKDIPPDLYVTGAKRYISLIIQNVLENARKYNRKGGLILVSARTRPGHVLLIIGNNGGAMTAEAQAHLFERFRRDHSGTPVVGHGLGLNLARELARLHGGDLMLVRSDNDWTEFELRLRAAESQS